MKTKKRFPALLLALCLLLSLCPAALAVGEEPIDLVDGSLEHSKFPQVGTVLSLETGEESLFHYDVPQDGATVLLFFKCGDRAMSSLLRELNETSWAGSEKLSFIAVESSLKDAEAVQTYLDEADTGGVIDLAYYNPTKRTLPYWYLAYIETRGEIGSSISGTISFPYVLLITEEEGQPVIRYAFMNISSVRDLGDCLAKLVEVEGLAPSGSTLKQVRVSGSRHYDFVQSVFSLVNAERSRAGLHALQLSAEVTTLAMQRAAECAVFYSGNHERPNGKGCFSIADDMPLTDAALTAENMAAGQISPAEVMEAWMDSTGHRNNILSERPNLLGVGCFESNGILFWVQLFGSGTDMMPLRQTVRTPCAAEVTVLDSHVEAALTAPEGLSLRVGEELSLPMLENRNPGYPFVPTLLLPWSEGELRDGETVIASVELQGDVLRLKGLEAGSAELLCPVWPGQEEPAVLPVAVQPACVHEWSAPVWTWTEDHSAASAAFVCTLCEAAEELPAELAVETVEASCEEAGKTVVTASVLFEEQAFEDRYEEEIPALGHEFENFFCLRCGAPDLANLDVDGNGELNAADALLFLRLASSGAELSALPDLNGDGRVNSRDAMVLFRLLRP